MPTLERCGLILDTGEIVELPNASERPADAILMRNEDLAKYKDNTVATWHTHPSTGPNLSTTDYMMFKSKPRWKHYIVSEKDVWCYSVVQNKVILDEEDSGI